MRVYEFSRQFGLPNKEIIKILQDEGFDIQNHMSVITPEMNDVLQKRLKPKSSQEELPKQKKEEKKEISAPSQIKIEQPDTKIEDTKKQMQIKEQIKTPKHVPLESKPKETPTQKQPEEVKHIVVNLKPMVLGDLAELINKPATEIILNLLKRGLPYNKNQVLPEEVVDQIVKGYGFETVKATKKEAVENIVKIGKDLTNRLPVVVVIGHVDHGKTTLLDFIRKTRVAAKEKGGITQHLGAYEVSTSKGGMVFLDTPGHEAFSMMRGRGVKVADIAILVVAADDGVMPQTVEALKLAQSKNIPIVVALNKVDKVDAARIEQVKNQLSKHNLLAEDWGGQTIVVPISAKHGQGIDQLLEMISLQAEIMELKADQSIDACGYVLESKIEKGLGPVATFIAQHGIIKIGSYFVCGNTLGKVTVLVDSRGNRVQQAGPSIPVQISGFEQLPQVGDYLQVVTEAEYRKAKSDKSERRIQPSLKAASTPEDTINIILKTDNDSSKEALINSIAQLFKKEDKEIYIVHSGVGNITENDVNLAASSGAVIYGFGVKSDSNVANAAQQNSVSIRLFDIIYHLIDNIKELIASHKEIQYKKVKTGEAIVRKVFDIKGVGVIAGFYVKDGKIVKDGQIVVYRASKKIGEGSIKTLQREKKSMKEIASGFEGALLIDGYKDWEVEDRMECFVNVAIE